MTWSDHALGGLSAAGLRRGGARTAVVAFLDEQRCCLSAQEIHEGIRGQGGAVGVASVYRALETLAALRLVQRVDVGDGVARFEPAGGDGHHVIITTSSAATAGGRAVHRRSARARARGAAGRLGYAMEQHEVVLRGACADCRGA